MVLDREPQLYEALCTTIGLEGLEDILEVMMIGAHNRRVIAEEQAREAEKR